MIYPPHTHIKWTARTGNPFRRGSGSTCVSMTGETGFGNGRKTGSSGLFHRRSVFLRLVAVLLLALASTQPGLAADGITGELFVVDRGAVGAEVLAAPGAGGVSPGDILEYRFVYRNMTDGPVSGVTMNGPIPAHTHYVEASAQADARAAFEVRVSGEDVWSRLPVMRRETRADGTRAETVVPASEYSELRWMLDAAVPPRAARTFRYRVQVAQ